MMLRVVGLAGRLAAILLAYVITSHVTQALQVTFELPDNQEFCFYENYNTTRVYQFTYNVIAGGENDVDCRVLSPTGLVIYQRPRAQGDQFKFQSSLGEFSFCFSNEFSTFTHKIVSFDLIDDGGHDEAVDRPNANTLAEATVQSIKQATTNIHTYQKQYRVGEMRGRYWAEQLNERVQWFSAINAVVMVFSAVGQVLVLRAFFAERRVTTSHERRISAPAPFYGSKPSPPTYTGVNLGLGSAASTSVPLTYS